MLFYRNFVDNLVVNFVFVQILIKRRQKPFSFITHINEDKKGHESNDAPAKL
jgi:hypothetical protein